VTDDEKSVESTKQRGMFALGMMMGCSLGGVTISIAAHLGASAITAGLVCASVPLFLLALCVVVSMIP
jgi:hypothetical protein